jgi:integrase/recombinase XerD
MRITDAIEGYLLDSTADGYSELTLRVYESALNVMVDFLGEKKELDDIQPSEIKSFMGYLRKDYRPKRASGNLDPLSTASLHRYWKAVRSFFNWAEKRLEISRPDIDLKMPAYSNAAITPYSKDELRRLLQACEAIEVDPSDRQAYKYRRPTRFRDKAILLLLLDTGVRIGECSRLRVSDVNLENGEVQVRPHHVRKTRPRTTLLGTAARHAVWRYLIDRENVRSDDPLFVSVENKPLTTTAYRSLFRRMGRRANVQNVHPHRFRHTFAIQFLRNGGDIFTLQRLLGHATLAMVNKYLNLAKSDIVAAHKRASPVDRWHL